MLVLPVFKAQVASRYLLVKMHPKFTKPEFTMHHYSQYCSAPFELCLKKRNAEVLRNASVESEAANIVLAKEEQQEEDRQRRQQQRQQVEQGKQQVEQGKQQEQREADPLAERRSRTEEPRAGSLAHDPQQIGYTAVGTDLGEKREQTFSKAVKLKMVGFGKRATESVARKKATQDFRRRMAAAESATKPSAILPVDGTAKPKATKAD